MCRKTIYYNTYGDGAEDVTERVDTCRPGKLCSHADVREYQRKFRFTKLATSPSARTTASSTASEAGSTISSLADRLPTPYHADHRSGSDTTYITVPSSPDSGSGGSNVYVHTVHKNSSSSSSSKRHSHHHTSATPHYHSSSHRDHRDHHSHRRHGSHASSSSSERKKTPRVIVVPEPPSPLRASTTRAGVEYVLSSSPSRRGRTSSRSTPVMTTSRSGAVTIVQPADVHDLGHRSSRRSHGHSHGRSRSRSEGAIRKELRFEDEVQSEIAAQNRRIAARQAPAVVAATKSILKNGAEQHHHSSPKKSSRRATVVLGEPFDHHRSTRASTAADPVAELRRAVERMDLATGSSHANAYASSRGTTVIPRSAAKEVSLATTEEEARYWNRLRDRFDDPRERDRKRRSRVVYPEAGVYRYM